MIPTMPKSECCINFDPRFAKLRFRLTFNRGLRKESVRKANYGPQRDCHWVDRRCSGIARQFVPTIMSLNAIRLPEVFWSEGVLRLLLRMTRLLWLMSDRRPPRCATRSRADQLRSHGLLRNTTAERSRRRYLLACWNGSE